MADRDKTFFGILNNISGVIMFGVPSLGMHQSHLMAMVEGQPNEFLVQDLSRRDGAPYLRDLNKRFEGVSFLQTTKVFWAYETRESPTVMVYSPISPRGLECALTGRDAEARKWHMVKNGDTCGSG